MIAGSFVHIAIVPEEEFAVGVQCDMVGIGVGMGCVRFAEILTALHQLQQILTAGNTALHIHNVFISGPVAPGDHLIQIMEPAQRAYRIGESGHGTQISSIKNW